MITPQKELHFCQNTAEATHGTVSIVVYKEPSVTLWLEQKLELEKDVSDSPSNRISS